MPNTVDSLLAITQRNLKSYGEEVVEQRAVPDYRDGLKPVHRFILWACYGLGLKSTGPFKKAARTVGDVIGRYSPHGDQATYQAMVGMAGVRSEDSKTWVTRNTSVPLIEGYGNWGDNLDNAAAMRYTEGRLSEFSDKYLLDPVYLAVSDYVLNFSQDEKVPLVLPAKLPVLLLNGSVSIAFGISAETPSFALPGVLSLVKARLSGVEITPTMCVKTLKFSPAYGGECVSDRAQVLQFFKDGAGSLDFLPAYIVDEKTRSVTLTSACPGLTSPASWKTLSDKLTSLPCVKSVSDSTDKSGFKFQVTAERSSEFQTFVDIILKMVQRKQSYSIGVTLREPSGVSFRRMTVPTLITEWCDWRVSLELRVIQHLLSLENTKLARHTLLLLAVDNLKVILDALRTDDSAAYISQNLKISIAEANTILDLKVRQLKSLEREKLKAQISECKAAIKLLTSDSKDPTKRILKELAHISVRH